MECSPDEAADGGWSRTALGPQLIEFRVRAGDRELPVVVLEPTETHRGIRNCRRTVSWYKP